MNEYNGAMLVKKEGKGTWVHHANLKSHLFSCSICGCAAYYPQSNNTRTSKSEYSPKIMYQYCPYCGHPMQIRP